MLSLSRLSGLGKIVVAIYGALLSSTFAPRVISLLRQGVLSSTSVRSFVKMEVMNTRGNPGSSL